MEAAEKKRRRVFVCFGNVPPGPIALWMFFPGFKGILQVCLQIVWLKRCFVHSLYMVYFFYFAQGEEEAGTLRSRISLDDACPNLA